MANLYIRCILGGCNSKLYNRKNIIFDYNTPVLCVQTSNINKYSSLIPLPILDKVLAVKILSNFDFTQYKSLFTLTSDTYLKTIEANTPLKFIKSVTSRMSSYFYKGIVERNSIYYGNSNILLDNDLNVLYLVCYDTYEDKGVVLVNKKALVEYGALSKAMLNSFLTSLSNNEESDNFPARSASYDNCDSTNNNINFTLGNINIIDEEDINSFVSEYNVFDESVPDEFITDILNQNFNLEIIKNNMFL